MAQWLSMKFHLKFQGIQHKIFWLSTNFWSKDECYSSFPITWFSQSFRMKLFSWQQYCQIISMWHRKKKKTLTYVLSSSLRRLTNICGRKLSFIFDFQSASGHLYTTFDFQLWSAIQLKVTKKSIISKSIFLVVCRNIRIAWLTKKIIACISTISKSWTVTNYCFFIGYDLN